MDSRENCEASRLIQAHRMLFELRMRILGYAKFAEYVESVLRASKIENPKILRMKFWTSHFDIKKCSKRPQDPHNWIRLEKQCPKVVSDRQNAGRITSNDDLGIFARSFILERLPEGVGEVSAVGGGGRPAGICPQIPRPRSAAGAWWLPVAGGGA